MGVEVSGIVADANGSKDFKNGDEVFGLAYGVSTHVPAPT